MNDRVKIRNTGMEARTCPFCKGRKLYVEVLWLDGTPKTFVCCRTCGATGPTCEAGPSLRNSNGADRATAAWNGEEEA